MKTLPNLHNEIYLHCIYTNKDGDVSLSLSDLAKKMYVESGRLAVNAAFFDPCYKKPNWYDTIFPAIEIMRDMRDKLPERHKDLYSIRPDSAVNFHSLILRLKQSLKEYFIRNWNSKANHICFHSAGYDSRIISGILTELRQERGDEWLGRIHFRCHQPEEKEFIEIMKLQGWRDDQYSVWEKSPDDHYNVGRTTQILNGFCPLTHQMDFASDIMNDSNKENTVLILGSNGGEFFSYHATGRKRVKDVEYCHSPNINRWLNYFAEEGEWLSMYAYEHENILAPFLSYDYLKLACLMPNRYVTPITRQLDSVRMAILETMSINTLSVGYGFHKYTWGIGEGTKKAMMEWYANSEFYEDYGIPVNFDNINNNISGHDGKLWAFSLMYEKIFM